MTSRARKPTLATYHEKRDFSRTAEPRGEARARGPKRADAKGSSYVIQKHAARRLHYDFRLELDGALLSWAVPKGPSLDPGVKRLAVETEPHPLEYGGFEGTIPKGQYGGGTVMVWDRGSWTPEGDARKAYEKGHLSFTLHGEKLRGNWHLVRTSRGGKDEKNWLLFKSRDEFAKTGGGELLEERTESALTGRSMEDIAAGKGERKNAPRVWNSNREPEAAPQARKAAPRSARAKSKPTEAAVAQAESYPLTNPDKVLYPEQGITKRELLDYYALVAERMLPHVQNRPLTLVRCPNGRGKPCFFQKHPGEGTPEGMRSISIRESEGKAPYSVIDDEVGLFGLVQLGSLEIHTWGSRADDFERPDLLVFDLDPDPDLPFRLVIEGARRLREIFASARLESFVKTTGGKGLHVCLPIEPDLSWDQAKDFSGRIAAALSEHDPNRYVATVSKAKRKGKIFVDYLRNARGATFVAPYSTRARENAPIAVPIEWDELDARFDPSRFTVRTVRKRLEKLARDPFERMATLRQRLRESVAAE
ncbi:MAG TPA: non-homologous end-joining DNA ligase [Polyangiaceae bacterium]